MYQVKIRIYFHLHVWVKNFQSIHNNIANTLYYTALKVSISHAVVRKSINPNFYSMRSHSCVVPIPSSCVHVYTCKCHVHILSHSHSYTIQESPIYIVTLTHIRTKSYTHCTHTHILIYTFTHTHTCILSLTHTHKLIIYSISACGLR